MWVRVAHMSALKVASESMADNARRTLMVFSSKCGSSASYAYLSGGSEKVDTDRDGVQNDRDNAAAVLPMRDIVQVMSSSK